MALQLLIPGEMRDGHVHNMIQIRVLSHQNMNLAHQENINLGYNIQISTGETACISRSTLYAGIKQRRLVIAQSLQ